MITIITERKLTQEEQDKYKTYNVVASRAEKRIKWRGIFNSSQVGFILNGYYNNTFKEMYGALMNGKKIQVKDTNNKTYTFTTAEELSKSVIAFAYAEAKKEYIQQKTDEKKADRLQFILNELNLTEIPEDLEYILTNFAYLYDIDYTTSEMTDVSIHYIDKETNEHKSSSKWMYRTNYDDIETKLKAYAQIKYYLMIKEPFVREARVEIAADEEEYREFVREGNLLVRYFGDSEYFEDYCNKHGVMV